MELLERVEAPAVAPVPSILDPRVERGARRMDERCPDWAYRVNPDTLSLRSSCFCVIGQTYGSYLHDRGAVFDFVSEDSVDLGFYARTDAQFAAFEQDWRLAILARRTTSA